MTRTVPLRQARSKIVGALLASLTLLIGLASPAAAAPPPVDPTTPPNEGSTPTLATLRANLEAAATGYLEAEAKLAASKEEQTKIELELAVAEAEMARLRVGVGRYAGEAYRTGRLGIIGVMLSASTNDDFLDRAMALDRMTQRDQANLNLFLEIKRRATEARQQIVVLIAQQTEALAEMTKRRVAAEKALAAVGGTPVRTAIDWSTLPTANPSPRNPDGSWPSETCSVDDPTPANGCITPRTLHALKEAQRLGWDWYVSCYRPGDQYEHPKGRACDFAAFPNGFVNKTASLANKVYGDRLAEFFAKNAQALGVMYVVWFCQIWHVGTGWRRYNSSGSRCGDAPAGDHTNHVHVSIL